MREKKTLLAHRDVLTCTLAVEGVDGTLIGFVSYGLWVKEPEYFCGYLHEVHVHKDWHRRGLATALVEDAKWHILSAGCPTVCHTVSKSNAAAIALYHSTAFTRREDCIDPEEHAIWHLKFAPASVRL